MTDMEKFKKLLARSSLGCPRTPNCGHMLYAHDYQLNRRGDPVKATCRRCDCGKKGK